MVCTHHCPGAIRYPIVVCVHKSHHSKLSWGQSIAEINILVMVMGGRLTSLCTQSRMPVFVCVCMCVCICVLKCLRAECRRLYVCVCVCTNSCARNQHRCMHFWYVFFTYICRHAHMHIHMHHAYAQARIYMSALVCAYMYYVYVNVYVYVCVYVYVYM